MTNVNTTRDNEKKTITEDALETLIWTTVAENRYQTLLDTGSTKSYINEQTLATMPRYAYIETDETKPLVISTAGGTIQKETQAVKMTFTITGHNYEQTVHVLDTLPVPILLGNDFLKQHSVHVKYNKDGRPELSFTCPEYLPPKTGEEEFKEDVKGKKERHRLTYATTEPKEYEINSKEVIQPKTSKLIKATVSPTIPYRREIDLIIDSNDTDVQYQITNQEDGEVTLLIINKKDTPRRIHNVKVTALPLYTSATEIIKDDASKEKKENNKKTLTAHEQNQLDEVLEEFKDVLAHEDDPIGTTHVVQHDIHTKDSPPIRQAAYRLAPLQKKRLEEELETLQKKDIIKPSNSPWSSPIVMVPKPDGSTRLCIDYRKLNNVTIKDAHPLPKIDELLDCLKDATVFSTLDLLSGYHQIALTPEAVPKTAFVTHKGLFEYIRMPFGLCNAPATFQRLVEQIFQSELWIFILLYIDDIIIFSKNFQEHIQHLRLTLQRLRESRLQAKEKKCHFVMDQVSFLGHTVSKDGVKVLKKNTDTVQKFEAPTTIKELRSFLGMTSYYRRFIEGYSKIARPLTTLLKKDTKFTLTDEAREAFTKLKEALISPPILQYPDYDKPFLLLTDASNEAIGHILAQKYDGKYLPIKYGGRTLNSAEKNYGVSEKEALALVHAIGKNHQYLHGRIFDVYTDHQPLQSLLNAKDPSGRLARWFLVLQRYQFRIHYLPGTLNVVADALSRLTKHEETDENTPDLTTLEEAEPVCMPIIPKQITKEVQDQDPDIQQLRRELEDPKSEMHEAFAIDSGLIYYMGHKKDASRRLCIPQHMKHEMIRMHHEPNYMGHFGINTTTNRLKEKYYWKGLIKDVTHFINNCKSCQRNKGRTQKAPIKPIPLTKAFKQIISDVAGPFPPTEKGNRYIISFIDRYTSWLEAFATKTMDTEVTATLFVNEIVFRYGVPDSFMTDNGTNYTSKMMKKVCELLEIEKIETTPYHPQTNGMIERTNQIILSGLRHHVDDHHKNWDELLPGVLFAYRTAVQSSRKQSPYTLVFGEQPVTPVDHKILPSEILTADTDDYLMRLKENLKTARNIADRQLNKTQTEMAARTEQPNFRQHPEGSFVWLQSNKRTKGLSPKLTPKFTGPHEIIKVHPPSTYTLKTRTGKTLKAPVHHDRLKLHQGDNEEFPTTNKKISEEQWEKEDDLPLIELRELIREEEENTPLIRLREKLTK